MQVADSAILFGLNERANARPALTKRTKEVRMAERYFNDMSAKETAAYWEKVDRRGDDECWPWLGAKRKKGHGVFFVDGKVVCCTHAALFLDSRPRPSGKNNYALHSCDNPPCVNPAHLRWGTCGENLTEAYDRGLKPRDSGVRGERIGTSKLTEDEVRLILTSPLNGAAIGRMLGVAKTTVSDIRRGRRWQHIK